MPRPAAGCARAEKDCFQNKTNETKQKPISFHLGALFPALQLPAVVVAAVPAAGGPHHLGEVHAAAALLLLQGAHVVGQHGHLQAAVVAAAAAAVGLAAGAAGGQVAALALDLNLKEMQMWFSLAEEIFDAPYLNCEFFSTRIWNTLYVF